MHTIKLISHSPSRREFIKGAAAGGFLLAFYVPARAVNEPEQHLRDIKGQFAPNALHCDSRHP
jgi:isoquinoline 1-oxidoreductase beta subunit